MGIKRANENVANRVELVVVVGGATVTLLGLVVVSVSLLSNGSSWS